MCQRSGAGKRKEDCQAGWAHMYIYWAIFKDKRPYAATAVRKNKWRMSPEWKHAPKNSNKAANNMPLI
jgi:hypothetical protein